MATARVLSPSGVVCTQTNKVMNNQAASERRSRRDQMKWPRPDSAMPGLPPGMVSPQSECMDGDVGPHARVPKCRRMFEHKRMWPKLGCERTSTKRKTLMPVKRRTRRVAEHETRRFPRIRTEEVTVAATFRKLCLTSVALAMASAGAHENAVQPAVAESSKTIPQHHDPLTWYQLPGDFSVLLPQGVKREERKTTIANQEVRVHLVEAAPPGAAQ